MAARAFSRKNWGSTFSMTAERECFDPAKRSIPAYTSSDSVIEVLSFILLIYDHFPVQYAGQVQAPDHTCRTLQLFGRYMSCEDIDMGGLFCSDHCCGAI